ncbi:MAG: 2-oxoacid ferredoxin oxidoreductase [Thermoleophilia bacterium]|nr:2-oxoacid ferredoxin oxidoreductase [Thermoleophilia bacterium]
MEQSETAWCPGCGNFVIWKILKETLAESGRKPEEVVIISGIGQAAKMPHYLKCHTFNGLHGRALPAATGIKVANPGMLVLAESGDGDMYGEGGNHFVHTIRRNPDITNIVHNNMVYGLTKGQASPTSTRGFHTPVQVDGVLSEPFNPIAVAISLNASFVARASTVDQPALKTILQQAIRHPGYALVDVLHPCVSFNKVNTAQWLRQNTYALEDDHDPGDRVEAFRRAIETERLPLGVFYVNPSKPVFERSLPAYQQDDAPLASRRIEMSRLAEFVRDSFR